MEILKGFIPLLCLVGAYAILYGCYYAGHKDGYLQARREHKKGLWRVETDSKIEGVTEWVGKVFDNLLSKFERKKSEINLAPSNLDLFFNVHILSGKYPTLTDDELQDLLSDMRELVKRIGWFR